MFVTARRSKYDLIHFSAILRFSVLRITGLLLSHLKGKPSQSNFPSFTNMQLRESAMCNIGIWNCFLLVYRFYLF